MSMLRMIVVAVIAWYAFDAAIKYGGIWQSQAHPSENVEVEFVDGAKATGALYQDWNGWYVLRQDKGGEVHFQHYSAMSFRSPARLERMSGVQAHAVPSMFVDNWRALGPPAAVLALFCLYVTGGLLIPRLRTSAAAKDSA